MASGPGGKTIGEWVADEMAAVHVEPLPAGERLPYTETARDAAARAVVTYSDAWHKATFPSSEASAQYHYGKHGGPWNSIEEYTEAAKQFYAENINLAQPHPLYTGETGVKIRTGQYFGIYTTDGRIISFGPR